MSVVDVVMLVFCLDQFRLFHILITITINHTEVNMSALIGVFITNIV